jgi:hypothetical protein
VPVPISARRPGAHVVVRLAVALTFVLGTVVGGLGTSAAAPLSPNAAVARGIVVSPDPAHDLYVGTGGLVVPAKDWRGDAGGRSAAAGCLDCHWRVSTLCTKAEFAAGLCQRIVIGCPVGTEPVRIWLLRPGQDWAVVGMACQGPTPPRTLADVGSAVHDRAVAALPPLHAAVQPADGALVSLPALFRTGQPADGIQGADLSVLGLDVRLDARVRWHWSYGDGTTQWTAVPGGSWPDMSVSHTYRHAQRLTALVTAVWRGEYVVEGLGPFAVPGPPLSQQQSVAVVVRAAHAHLVG